MAAPPPSWRQFHPPRRTLGPLLLFSLWRFWGRGLGVPAGRLALLGPARGAGVEAARSGGLLRGPSDRRVRWRLGSRSRSVPGWPPAVRSGFGTLAANPLFARKPPRPNAAWRSHLGPVACPPPSGAPTPL